MRILLALTLLLTACVDATTGADAGDSPDVGFDAPDSGADGTDTAGDTEPPEDVGNRRQLVVTTTLDELDGACDEHCTLADALAVADVQGGADITFALPDDERTDGAPPTGEQPDGRGGALDWIIATSRTLRVPPSTTVRFESDHDLLVAGDGAEPVIDVWGDDVLMEGLRIVDRVPGTQGPAASTLVVIDAADVVLRDITLQGRFGVVVRNVVSGNIRLEGIDVWSTDTGIRIEQPEHSPSEGRVRLMDSTINSSRVGVMVGGGVVDLRGSKFKSNDTGVLVKCGDVSVGTDSEPNVFTFNDIGVLYERSSHAGRDCHDGLTIAGNIFGRVDKPNEIGIAIDGGRATIVDNEFLNNSEASIDGVRAWGDTQIVGNQFVGNQSRCVSFGFDTRRVGEHDTLSTSGTLSVGERIAPYPHDGCQGPCNEFRDCSTSLEVTGSDDVKAFGNWFVGEARRHIDVSGTHLRRGTDGFPSPSLEVVGNMVGSTTDVAVAVDVGHYFVLDLNDIGFERPAGCVAPPQPGTVGVLARGDAGGTISDSLIGCVETGIDAEVDLSLEGTRVGRPPISDFGAIDVAGPAVRSSANVWVSGNRYEVQTGPVFVVDGSLLMDGDAWATSHVGPALRVGSLSLGGTRIEAPTRPVAQVLGTAAGEAPTFFMGERVRLFGDASPTPFITLAPAVNEGVVAPSGVTATQGANWSRFTGQAHPLAEVVVYEGTPTSLEGVRGDCRVDQNGAFDCTLPGRGPTFYVVSRAEQNGFPFDFVTSADVPVSVE